MMRRTVLWIALAVLGIAMSAAIAWSASRLASQRIGLSSAPVSVTAGLAPPPPAARQPSTERKRAKPSHSTPAAGSGSGSPRAVGVPSQSAGTQSTPYVPPAPMAPTGQAAPASGTASSGQSDGSSGDGNGGGGLLNSRDD